MKNLFIRAGELYMNNFKCYILNSVKIQSNVEMFLLFQCCSWLIFQLHGETAGEGETTCLQKDSERTPKGKTNEGGRARTSVAK